MNVKFRNNFLNYKKSEIKIKNKEIKGIVPTQVLEGEIKPNVLKDFKLIIIC